MNKISAVKELRSNIIFETMVVFFASLLFYSFFVGSKLFYSTDNMSYVAASLNMVHSGDYITPKIMGTLFFDKPIMYYWLEAFTFKFLGFNGWTMRLPQVITAALFCGFLYYSARILFSRPLALIATVIFITSGFAFRVQYEDMNTEIGVFIFASFLCFLLGYHYSGQKSSKWWYWAAYFFMGIAFLTKGTVAVVLPVGIIGLWILILRKWYLLKQMRIFSGFLLFFAVTLPWLYLAEKHNPGFIYEVLVHQQFNRFLDHHTTYTSPKPPYFYLQVLIKDFFVWLILFIPAAKAIFQRLRNKEKTFAEKNINDYLIFCLVCIGFTFLFFTFSSGKLPHYIYPLYPALAILIAYYCASLWESNTPANGYIKVCSILTYIALPLFAIAGVGLIYKFKLFSKTLTHMIWVGPKFFPYIIAIIAIIYLIPLIYGFVKRGSFRYFLVLTTIFTVTIWLLIYSSYAQMLWKHQRSTKIFVPLLEKQLIYKPKIVMYNTYLPDLAIYLNYPVSIITNWDDMLKANVFIDDYEYKIALYCIKKQHSCPLVIRYYQELKDLWQSPSKMYVVTEVDELNNFRQNIGDYHIIAKDKFNSIFLITNH